jgi:hypothetical protein
MIQKQASTELDLNLNQPPFKAYHRSFSWEEEEEQRPAKAEKKKKSNSFQQKQCLCWLWRSRHLQGLFRLFFTFFFSLVND